MQVTADVYHSSLEGECVVGGNLTAFRRGVGTQNNVAHLDVAPRDTNEFIVYLSRDCRYHSVVAVNVAVKLGTLRPIDDMLGRAVVVGGRIKSTVCHKRYGIRALRCRVYPHFVYIVGCHDFVTEDFFRCYKIFRTIVLKSVLYVVKKFCTRYSVVNRVYARVCLLVKCRLTQLRHIVHRNAVSYVDIHCLLRVLRRTFVFGIFCADFDFDGFEILRRFEQFQSFGIEHEFVDVIAVETCVFTALDNFEIIRGVKRSQLVDSCVFRFTQNHDTRIVRYFGVAFGCQIFVSFACKNRLTRKTYRQRSVGSAQLQRSNLILYVKCDLRLIFTAFGSDNNVTDADALHFASFVDSRNVLVA